MTLDVDAEKRVHQMQLVARFMRRKMSSAFTMASELTTPDAVCCVGVSHHECHGVLSLISRSPTRFGAEQWLTRAEIGDEVPSLLPRGAATLDAAALRELDEWFGTSGRFPAVPIENR